MSAPRNERARFNIVVVLLFKLRPLSGTAAGRMFRAASSEDRIDRCAIPVRKRNLFTDL